MVLWLLLYCCRSPPFVIILFGGIFELFFGFFCFFGWPGKFLFFYRTAKVRSLLCLCLWRVHIIINKHARSLDKELCFRGIYATDNYWVTPFLQHFAIIFYLRFTVLCFLSFPSSSPIVCGNIWDDKTTMSQGLSANGPCNILTVFTVWTYFDLSHAILFIQYCACYQNRISIIQTKNKEKVREENCWLLEHHTPRLNGCIGGKTQKPYRNGQTIMIIFKWKWSTVDVWLYGEKIRISLNWFVRLLLGTDNPKKKK